MNQRYCYKFSKNHGQRSLLQVFRKNTSNFKMYYNIFWGVQVVTLEKSIRVVLDINVHNMKASQCRGGTRSVMGLLTKNCRGLENERKWVNTKRRGGRGIFPTLRQFFHQGIGYEEAAQGYELQRETEKDCMDTLSP